MPRGVYIRKSITEEHRSNLRRNHAENPNAGMKGKRHSEETKRKMSKSGSEALTKRYKEPKAHIIASARAKRQFSDPRQRQMKSDKMIKEWTNSEYVKKQMISRNVKQNKKEKLFEEFLDKWFPSEWRFVGDGEVIIGGKCPDYANINGKKALIELYGNYFHRGQNPQDRIDFYQFYGYDCLVVWEKELKDLDELERKINDKFYREREMKK